MYQFIHLPNERHFDCLQVLAVTHRTALNICVQVLVVTKFLNPLGKYQGAWSLGLYGKTKLSFIRVIKLSSKVTISFYIPTAMYESSVASHACQYLILSVCYM